MSKTLLFSELLEHAAELDIRVNVTGCMCVVDLVGDVDKYTSPRLSSTIFDLLEDGIRRIVLGMDNVDYIDSTGLVCLVSGLQSAGKLNGEFAISGANSRIRKALEVTGLSKIIPLFDDESDAIGSFSTEEAALAA